MLTIGFLEIAIILTILPVLTFEICMFINVLRNERLTQKAKIIWAIAMLLLHPFVALYYYFTARRLTKQPKRGNKP